MRACGCRSSVIDSSRQERWQFKARALAVQGKRAGSSRQEPWVQLLLWFLPTANFHIPLLLHRTLEHVFPAETNCSNRGNRVSVVEREIPFQMNDMIYPVISVISTKSGFPMWLLKNVPEE